MAGGVYLVLLDAYICIRCRNASELLGKIARWACVVAVISLFAATGSLMILFTQVWVAPNFSLALTALKLSATGYLMATFVAFLPGY